MKRHLDIWKAASIRIRVIVMRKWKMQQRYRSIRWRGWSGRRNRVMVMTKIIGRKFKIINLRQGFRRFIKRIIVDLCRMGTIWTNMTSRLLPRNLRPGWIKLLAKPEELFLSAEHWTIIPPSRMWKKLLRNPNLWENCKFWKRPQAVRWISWQNWTTNTTLSKIS